MLRTASSCFVSCVSRTRLCSQQEGLHGGSPVAQMCECLLVCSCLLVCCVLHHGAYQAIISCRGTSTPALHLPPLSTNSTALKWEAPVSEATRTAAAGLLVQLLQLPNLQRAVSDRLAASRLSTLLNSSMQELGEAAGDSG